MRKITWITVLLLAILLAGFIFCWAQTFNSEKREQNFRIKIEETSSNSVKNFVTPEIYQDYVEIRGCKPNNKL